MDINSLMAYKSTNDVAENRRTNQGSFVSNKTAFKNNDKINKSDNTDMLNGRFDKNECETCKNRKYQDGSNDPSVSFKTPGHIDAAASASAVLSHEYEHVANERSNALRENKDIVYQSVTLKTGICPECGRVYTSGGVTKTVTRKNSEVDEILKNLQKDEQ